MYAGTVVRLILVGWTVLWLAAPARAEPTTLRLAALAPEGTAWAREVHAMAREVERATHGDVMLHWYLGGIAGDEFTVLDRIRRGQLDGSAGSLFCERLAPTLSLTRIVGLFQNRAEWTYVFNALEQVLDREFSRSGFVRLGVSSFGRMMLFGRHPVRSMADLRRERLWSYDLDQLLLKVLRSMGWNVVPLPIGDALRAYEDGRIDGFLTSPTVALAFQWSKSARYYTELTISMIPACFVVAQRSFDAMSIEQQAVVRAAATRLSLRFTAISAMQEDELLGGLLQRQGLERVPIDEAFRSDFLELARRVRDDLGPSLAEPRTLSRVFGLLADYRATHAQADPPTHRR
jgi:TRAP-type C4-dicarboxylate transport system substrate-binding protein